MSLFSASRAGNPAMAGMVPDSRVGQIPSDGRTTDRTGTPGSDSRHRKRQPERAAQYEKEMEQLKASCFLTSSSRPTAPTYITHIRILEDGLPPQRPLPQRIPRNQKKERVIVVGVRLEYPNTGAPPDSIVMIYKTRENSNGSYSIGKEWPMSDLSHVEAITSAYAESDDHEHGLKVILGKPYYWEAVNLRERDYFISSLVRIYNRYTNGGMPNLVGFSDEQLAAITRGCTIASGGNTAIAAAVMPPQPVSTVAPPTRPSAGHDHHSSRGSSDSSRSRPSHVGLAGRRDTATSDAPRFGTSSSTVRLSQPPRFGAASNRPGAGSGSVGGGDGDGLDASFSSSRNGAAGVGVVGVIGAAGSTTTAESSRGSASTIMSIVPSTAPTSVPATAAIKSPSSGSAASTLFSPALTGVSGATSNLLTPTTSNSIISSGSDGSAVSGANKSRNAAMLFRTAVAAQGFRPRAGGAADLGGLSRPQKDRTSVRVGGPQSPIGDRAGSSTQSAAAQAGVAGANLEQGNDKGPTEDENMAQLGPQRSNHQRACLTALGVDAAVLKDQSVAFESLLDRLGWGTGSSDRMGLEALDRAVGREVDVVEAGAVIARADGRRDREAEIESAFDSAIAMCDTLDRQLRLFGTQLETVRTDVNYIEEQSQGLQVQAANQKLLEAELTGLLNRLDVPVSALDVLIDEPLGTSPGLRSIEGALTRLYEAVEATKPSASASAAMLGMNPADGLTEMRALREKREEFLKYVNTFTTRLSLFMDTSFKEAFGPDKKLEGTRGAVWRYSVVMRFVRDTSPAGWTNLMQIYSKAAQSTFRNQVQFTHTESCRLAQAERGAPTIVFNHTDVDLDEGKSSASRKLTMKRSYTLARALKGGERQAGHSDRATRGTLLPYECFGRFLDQSIQLILAEQNFIVHFFHASSATAGSNSASGPSGMARPSGQLVAGSSSSAGSAGSFANLVRTTVPADDRFVPNLKVIRPFESDRQMATAVTDIVGQVFAPWPMLLGSLSKWVAEAEPVYQVAILFAIERRLAELSGSDQDFAVRALQLQHDTVRTGFNRFVTDQIVAIGETRVKISKRKGVISFFHTFPHFVSAIENMLGLYGESDEADGSNPVASSFDVRLLVDSAYDRIVSAMFGSLQVIAKATGLADGSVIRSGQAAADPDDKEALNYHVLIIQNMNHFLAQIDPAGNSILVHWTGQAQTDFDDHMMRYLDVVIRRPLGKLLDFLDSAESIVGLKLTAQSAAAVGLRSRPTHSPTVFHRLMSAYETKDIRRGAEALRRRIEKHFTDNADTPAGRALADKVSAAARQRYVATHARASLFRTEVYPDEELTLWPVPEQVPGFYG